MSWPFTVDQTIAVFGPGTIAAVIAAVFAWRADWFVRRQSVSDARRRDLDIQPRLTAKQQVGNGGMVSVRMLNVGGPAVHFIWVGTSSDHGLATAGSMGSGTGSLDFTSADVGRLSYPGGTGTILLIAEDVEGCWRDCRTRIKLPNGPEHYVTRRLEQCAMGEMARTVWALCGPKLLPPEASIF